MIGAAAFAAPAAAERPIVVDFTEVSQPFTTSELTEAIRMRVAIDGPPLRLQIAAIEGGVRIETAGLAREVSLGGLTGPAAARLVALAAADLVLDQLAVEPTSAPPSSVSMLVARRSHLAIGAVGDAASWGAPLAGAALDIALVHPRGWTAAITAGGSWLVGGPLSVTAATVRVALGVHLESSGRLELRAGATVVPVFVHDGIGDRTVMVGAHASLRARVRLSERFGLVIAGGSDVFATTTTYVANGMTVLDTPRVAPWLAAGMEIAP